MGGVAIEGAERLDAATYAAVVEFCKARLKAQRIQETASVRDKTTHGDVDLIVAAEDECLDLQALQPTKQVSTRDITSVGIAFEGRIYQIDIQRTIPELFEHQHAFNSYGLFGMCMVLGLRHACPSLVYGVHGIEWRPLDLPHATASGSFTPFLLSTSHAAIMEFLQLDTQQFNQGFDSYEDVFRFVVQCPYIDAQTLAKDMLRSATKSARAKKFLSRVRFLQSCDFSGTRAALPLPDPLQHFGKEQEFAAAVAGIQHAKKLAHLLNGRLVQDITGLRRVQLGLFIKAVRAAPRDWLHMSREELHAGVLEEAGLFLGEGWQVPETQGLAPVTDGDSRVEPDTGHTFALDPGHTYPDDCGHTFPQ